MLTSEKHFPLDKRLFAHNVIYMGIMLLAATGSAVGIGMITPYLGVVLAAFSVVMALLIGIVVTGIQQIRTAWRAGTIGRPDLGDAILSMLGVAVLFALGLINTRIPELIFGAMSVASFVRWVIIWAKEGRTRPCSVRR